MSDLIIHVIPDAYWGGRIPKGARKKEAGAARKLALSPRALFWIVVGGMFLIVVAAAAWYFTRPLRVKPAPVLPPPVEIPAPPAETEALIAPSAEPKIPPAPEPPLTEPVSEAPAPPPVWEDTDRDGLSNAEEILYHSGPTQPDTDKDGFLDGHEIFHLYNASGNAPERLEETNLVRWFNENSFGYAVLIPSPWQIQTNLETPGKVTIADGEGGTIFSIQARENSAGLSAKDWYSQNWPGEPSSPWRDSKAGLEIQAGADRRRAAIKGPARLYLLEDLEDGARPTYRTTFTMMLNSLRIMN
ncbi:hypothetical protein HYW17_03300 [Candidatus Uhrbacteria bacterium]|nr:hypothetical protein [Candidatus Uhrbacteria bacterium]